MFSHAPLAVLTSFLLYDSIARAQVISAASLFTGPAAPVVNLGYAKYRGKQDSKTKTANYLGLKFANAP